MTTEALERMLSPEELAAITPWSEYRIRELARMGLIRSHQIHAGKKGSKIGILYSQFLEDTECGMSPAQEFERRCAQKTRRTA